MRNITNMRRLRDRANPNTLEYMEREGYKIVELVGGGICYIEKRHEPVTYCDHIGHLTWMYVDYISCESCGERLTPEDVERVQRWSKIIYNEEE